MFESRTNEMNKMKNFFLAKVKLAPVKQKKNNFYARIKK